MKPLVQKKHILWTLGTIVLIVLLYSAAHFYVKNKIAHGLKEELTSTLQVEYEALSLSLLFNHLSLENITLAHQSVLNTTKIGSLSLNGFGYLEYLRHGTISVEHIKIDDVKAAFYTKDSTETKKSKTSAFKEKIKVHNFQLTNANVRLIDRKTDSLQFSAEAITMSLQDVKVSSNTVQNKIPFTYSSYTLAANAIKTALGPYEDLYIDKFKLDGAVVINGVELKTKYTKVALQKHISKERDWIYLKIPEVTLSKFDFTIEQDSFDVKIPSVVLKDLALEMYRNKLMPDDYSLKDMFGKTIRNLPFGLTIPCLMVENGSVSYSELVAPGTKPGELIFTEVTSVMKNISSVGSKPLTIKNKAKIMGAAPIELDWSFYEENGKHLFKASGVISNFNTKELDAFLRPNLRAEAKGTIDALYFTISGDEFVSSGDLKMSYSDFSFVVLKKDRLGVNKLLTALVNIFTNDGSKTDEYGFRFGQIKVERDPTKSFFNYLWINVKDGILHTFTGNGKKEEK
ncbi:hypothetical protein [Cellulophaga sp. L1A9]|uniref:hypothetical protein n=1 Tax=Cellulophaga sp. L1A9 TaxID=2686362 RepID=UPI00131D9670|nr:hypothetical protein [Cellulophaga sp. L1A9]